MRLLATWGCVNNCILHAVFEVLSHERPGTLKLGSIQGKLVVRLVGLLEQTRGVEGPAMCFNLSLLACHHCAKGSHLGHFFRGVSARVSHRERV